MFSKGVRLSGSSRNCLTHFCEQVYACAASTVTVISRTSSSHAGTIFLRIDSHKGLRFDYQHVESVRRSSHSFRSLVQFSSRNFILFLLMFARPSYYQRCYLSANIYARDASLFVLLHDCTSTAKKKRKERKIEGKNEHIKEKRRRERRKFCFLSGGVPTTTI